MMERFSQVVSLQSGEVTVEGQVLRAWGGDLIRQIVESGYAKDGRPLSGDELREADSILNSRG